MRRNMLIAAIGLIALIAAVAAISATKKNPINGTASGAVPTARPAAEARRDLVARRRARP